MSIIKVNCVDQTLVFENTPVIASGGLEENFVQFSFCSQWDGFTKTAVFWRSESEVFHNLLDEENSCQVAPEVTASDGIIYFGVFGVDSAGRQRTSEVLTYRIVKGAITEGTVPSDPTPDIYTQLLTKYQEMVEIAEDTREKEQAFEQAMTAAQQAFERAMAQRQTQHEADVDADQEAFEAAMNAAYDVYKQEIRAMIEAGLLPDDSITTEKLKDGVVTAEKIAPGVLIDAFTKQQTMTAATAALFGLGADAVPDDAFGLLSRFQSGLGNEYVWAKQASGLVDVVVKSSTTSIIDLGADNVVDAYAVASVVDGNIVLSYKSSNIYPYSNAVGYYAYYNGNPYYLTAFEGSSPNSIKFSANLLTVGQEVVQGVVGYVNSPNPNAYPIDDGYTYTALGQIGNKVQIATGSYTGTGTYGASNPNSLTFDFAPKVIMAVCARYTNSGSNFPNGYSYAPFFAETNQHNVVHMDALTSDAYGWRAGLGQTNSSKYPYGKKSADGKTLYWYHEGGAGYQYNTSGYTYYYIAIG